MSSLPEEICLDILLRVPVKSTFVCKCVCKRWYALISDPDFVKSHLDRSSQTNKCSLLVKTDKAYKLYSSFDSDDDAHFVELKTSYKFLRNRNTKLLASCNGLVYGRNYQMKFLILWNPATNEYKRLPNSPGSDKFDNGYNSFGGFGYDYKTDDYKLVTIILAAYKRYLVQVYSLKSNSWRSLQSPQYEFRCPQESGVLFNGALHWFGGMKDETSFRTIVSMDISEERFEELQPPMPLSETDQYFMNIRVLNGCLCVLVANEETFDIWVMQEYGVSDSWTELYSITCESIRCRFYSLELIGSFKNGEILFKDKCSIVSYDSMYGTARKTEIDDLNGGGAVKYFESLVSLNSIAKKSMTKKRIR